MASTNPVCRIGTDPSRAATIAPNLRVRTSPDGRRMFDTRTNRNLVKFTTGETDAGQPREAIRPALPGIEAALLLLNHRAATLAGRRVTRPTLRVTKSAADRFELALEYSHCDGRVRCPEESGIPVGTSPAEWHEAVRLLIDIAVAEHGLGANAERAATLKARLWMRLTESQRS